MVLQPVKLILATGLLLLSAVSLMAQTATPQFKDYAVREKFSGQTAPLVLSRDARMFKTRLNEAARGKPNFGGHYIVTSWGCGTECVQGAIINARTGHVFMLPDSLCCWGFDVDEKFKPIEYRPDSKLIILTGARNEKEGDNATRFYTFENNRLRLIKSIPR